MSINSATPSPDAGAARRPGLVCALIVGLFLAAAVPIIVRGYDGGRGAYDAITFHHRAIEKFAVEWPRLELSDYASATTPGFHFILAFARRHVTGNAAALRMIGALFTVGLLATLSIAVGRRLPPREAAATCLPIVFCSYVFSSGAWLVPDNAGWWCALGLVIFSLRERSDITSVAGGSLLLAVAVLMRQSTLWAAAPLLAAAWMPLAWAGAKGPALPTNGHSSIATRLFSTLIILLPATLILTAFARIWHGLTPPYFQRYNAGVNLAAPALVLAVAGAVAPFYAGGLLPRRATTRNGWRAPAAGALIGLALSALPRTNYDFAAGRWSGLWNIARVLPTFSGRSPFIISLATLGGAAVGALAAAQRPRDRIVLLATWASFLIASAASRIAFQRYDEPFVLLIFALFIARANPSDLMSRDGPPRRPRPWATAGPILLAAVLLFGVTIPDLRQPVRPSPTPDVGLRLGEWPAPL